MEKKKIMILIPIIIILLSALLIYVDYRKQSGEVIEYKEVNKIYPFVINRILYVDNVFSIALKKITKVKYIDDGGIPFYFLEYKISANKQGGLSMCIRDFRKIERYFY